MKKSRTLTGLVLLLAVASCAKVSAEHECGVVFDVTADQVLADVTKSNVSDYTVLPQPDVKILPKTIPSAIIPRWKPTAPLPAK